MRALKTEHDMKNEALKEELTGTDPGSISLLLSQVRTGDDTAHEQLFRHLCEMIRPNAAALMLGERSDHTLTVSALINEACVRLLQGGVTASAPNRRYLYAAAHRAMCRVLVDYARAKKADKRQANHVHLDAVLEHLESRTGGPVDRFSEALDELGCEESRLREVVELRFLSGFSVEETAEILDVHPRTVTRDWRLARARLYLLLNPDRACT